MHNGYKVDLDRLNVSAPPVLKRYQGIAMVVAALGVIGTIIGFISNSTQAFHSFLIGFMLCMGLTLGPLGFIFVWYCTGGRWGYPMRRIWEAANRNIWYCVILFVGIVIGWKQIFPWAHPENYHENANVTRLIHSYLNFNFFLGRGIIYFLCFIVLIYLSNHWSSIQDRPHTFSLNRRLNTLGGVGIVVYFFAMSFAAMDWMMSLRPAWPSTIYAMNIIVTQGILALGLGIVVGTVLVNYEPMNTFMDKIVFHDNGKLFLAFTMLWAYTAFSQWLIIWSGNLPEEIVFYLDRLRGGWQYASLFLAVFHFCIPFAMLLSASLKKNPSQLVWVAVWQMVMCWWDYFWNIEGAYKPANFSLSWMDVVIPVGMVGIWAALFLRNLMARPLLPLYDPHLLQMVEAEHE
ncbi:MAG TPA: hypothetical protein VG897_11380 [Terriglobales bacterium]|nr:hypothetical protein [Terriglobales bacterium]